MGLWCHSFVFQSEGVNQNLSLFLKMEIGSPKWWVLQFCDWQTSHHGNHLLVDRLSQSHDNIAWHFIIAYICANNCWKTQKWIAINSFGVCVLKQRFVAVCFKLFRVTTKWISAWRLHHKVPRARRQEQEQTLSSINLQKALQLTKTGPGKPCC